MAAGHEKQKRTKSRFGSFLMVLLILFLLAGAGAMFVNSYFSHFADDGGRVLPTGEKVVSAGADSGSDDVLLDTDIPDNTYADKLDNTDYVETKEEVKKVVDKDIVTVDTAFGEVEGKVVNGKIGGPYFVIDKSGTKGYDYKFNVDGASEKVYEDKGLSEVQEKYNIYNHAIQLLNTDYDEEYDIAIMSYNVEKDAKGNYDPTTGVIVYEGEAVFETMPITGYLNLCSEKTKNKIQTEKKYEEYVDEYNEYFLEGCQKWL